MGIDCVLVETPYIYSYSLTKHGKIRSGCLATNTFLLLKLFMTFAHRNAKFFKKRKKQIIIFDPF